MHMYLYISIMWFARRTQPPPWSEGGREEAGKKLVCVQRDSYIYIYICVWFARHTQPPPWSGGGREKAGNKFACARGGMCVYRHA